MRTGDNRKTTKLGPTGRPARRSARRIRRVSWIAIALLVLALLGAGLAAYRANHPPAARAPIGISTRAAVILIATAPPAPTQTPGSSSTRSCGTSSRGSGPGGRPGRPPPIADSAPDLCAAAPRQSRPPRQLRRPSCLRRGAGLCRLVRCAGRPRAARVRRLPAGRSQSPPPNRPPRQLRRPSCRLRRGRALQNRSLRRRRLALRVRQAACRGRSPMSRRSLAGRFLPLDRPAKSSAGGAPSGRPAGATGRAAARARHAPKPGPVPSQSRRQPSSLARPGPPYRQLRPRHLR